MTMNNLISYNGTSLVLAKAGKTSRLCLLKVKKILR